MTLPHFSSSVTSNLPVASVYHGPEGLRRIAARANAMARLLVSLIAPRFKPLCSHYFDTLCIDAGETAVTVLERARALRINLRDLSQEGLPGQIAVAPQPLPQTNAINWLPQ